MLVSFHTIIIRRPIATGKKRLQGVGARVRARPSRFQAMTDWPGPVRLIYYRTEPVCGSFDCFFLLAAACLVGYKYIEWLEWVLVSPTVFTHISFVLKTIKKRRRERQRETTRKRCCGQSLILHSFQQSVWCRSTVGLPSV